MRVPEAAGALEPRTHCVGSHACCTSHRALMNCGHVFNSELGQREQTAQGLTSSGKAGMRLDCLSPHLCGRDPLRLGLALTQVVHAGKGDGGVIGGADERHGAQKGDEEQGGAHDAGLFLMK